jgi:hypothetical protein
VARGGQKADSELHTVTLRRRIVPYEPGERELLDHRLMLRAAEKDLLDITARAAWAEGLLAPDPERLVFTGTTIKWRAYVPLCLSECTIGHKR